MYNYINAFKLKRKKVNNMGFLEGKTVIVTGGGRAVLEDGTCGSIGYGIVTAFA